MFSSAVSEGEFNVVIPEISAFSFIQHCVGDAAVCLFLEFMLMRGGALSSSAIEVVVGNANNVLLLLFFSTNCLLCSQRESTNIEPGCLFEPLIFIFCAVCVQVTFIFLCPIVTFLTFSLSTISVL